MLRVTHHRRNAMVQHIMRTHILLPSAVVVLAACATAPHDAVGDWPAPTLNGARALIIAHRGASGERPEHTLAAYQLAVDQGADCIEPDLVMTKDGVLVSRHDIYLSTTTDVASRPEFASRKRAATDAEHSGQQDWWVVDFTLAELKTLRARQPFDGRSKAYDGRFDIPTFDEVLTWARSRTTAAGKPVCVYPEAKAPAFHAARGLEMSGPILAALKQHGFAGPDAPVFIQSFEPAFVKEMNGLTDMAVVMLVGDKAALDSAMAMPGAPFWDGLGANTGLLFNADGTSSGVIEASHARGIPVHAWTFRDDAPLRAAPWNSEASEASMRRAFSIGLDGAFTDFPATGVAARTTFQAGE